MAEMKIRNGPLRLTLIDDKGRVVAALRYPKVRWRKLVIESEEDEFDAVVLGSRRVRLEKRPPASEDDRTRRPPDWDPFSEIEWGVRDFLNKLGEAFGFSEAPWDTKAEAGGEAAEPEASEEPAEADEEPEPEGDPDAPAG